AVGHASPLNKNPLKTSTDKEGNVMLRHDNLLTRENLIDIWSMLSEATRKTVRNEIHEAQITAQKDVADARDGTAEKQNIKEQENLALYALQTVDQATAEYADLHTATTTLPKAQAKNEPSPAKKVSA